MNRAKVVITTSPIGVPRTVELVTPNGETVELDFIYTASVKYAWNGKIPAVKLVLDADLETRIENDE